MPQAPITDILLGTTAEGSKVYDHKDSHIYSVGGLTPELLKETLAKVHLKECRICRYTVLFKRKVGVSQCVPIMPDDRVVMVYRKGKKGQTPMVKGREPMPSCHVTLVIRKDEKIENHYTLVSGYVGAGSPQEPWDRQIRKNPKEQEKSRSFWESHAMIWNPDEIDWKRTPQEVKDI